MNQKKVVCVWVGTYESEEKLFENYMNIPIPCIEDDDYFVLHEDENYDEDRQTQFHLDAGLEYIDEDFQETWWLDNFTLNNIVLNDKVLPYSSYFFDDLLDVLKTRDLSQRNFITFVFGEITQHSTSNTELFDLNPHNNNNNSNIIEFVFKKEYLA